MAPDPSRAKLLGFAYAALAAALWSLITPFSRELFSLGMAPFETAFWRAFMSGTAYALLSVRSVPRPPLRDAMAMFFVGGAICTVMFGAFQVSIERSGGATAVVLLYTAPAWVAVFSHLIFREAISRAKLAAVAVALAGVVLVSLSGGSLQGSFSAVGIVAGLLAGLGYAGCFPYTAWFGRKYPPRVLYAYAFLGSALFLLPFCLPMEMAKPAHVWGLLAAMSLLTNFFAYVALAMSLKYITQVQSAVVGNIEPVLGTLWVCLLFGENFTPGGWAGCVLVLSAVLLLTLEKRPGGR